MLSIPESLLATVAARHSAYPAFVGLELLAAAVVGSQHSTRHSIGHSYLAARTDARR